MCFFRFFNTLLCTGKHATSVMFYKVKMTKKAAFWPNATCHLAVHFLNRTVLNFFFGLFFFFFFFFGVVQLSPRLAFFIYIQ